MSRPRHSEDKPAAGSEGSGKRTGGTGKAVERQAAGNGAADDARGCRICRSAALLYIALTLWSLWLIAMAWLSRGEWFKDRIRPEREHTHADGIARQ
jgi:hypothetical protein